MIPQCEKKMQERNEAKKEKNELNKILEDLKVKYYDSGTGSGIEWFQNWVITDAVSKGVSIWQLNLNGNQSCAIVQKANNRYLTFISFGYTKPATQYNYLDGTWQSKEL